MANWIDLGATEEFPAGQPHCRQIDGHEFVVLHVEDEFYALKNVCPHAGLPLGEGEARGLVLTCPFHGYAYNVKTGKNIDFPDTEIPVRTFPTKLVDGRVLADLAPPA